VEELGRSMGMSRVQLYRKVKSLTNYAPNELLRIARLKKATSLLSSSDMTIAEITYEVGFTSPSYFTKCYKDHFGESPTDFLKRKG
jgi:transcriptional regulator GlxA family with amidase domain